MKPRQLAEKEHLHEETRRLFLSRDALAYSPGRQKCRSEFIEKAIAALKSALQVTSVPKRRGHLMGDLSGLYRQLGQRREAELWLLRAGEISRKRATYSVLRTFTERWATYTDVMKNLDGEIASYRTILALIQGRSFHQLAAGNAHQSCECFAIPSGFRGGPNVF